MQGFLFSKDSGMEISYIQISSVEKRPEFIHGNFLTNFEENHESLAHNIASATQRILHKYS